MCVKKAEFFSAFFELFQKVMQNPIEISQKHGFWIQACKSAKKIEIGTNDLSKSCPGSVQEDKSLLVGSSCPSSLFLRDGHLSDSVLRQIDVCKANIKVVHRICILGNKIRILPRICARLIKADLSWSFGRCIFPGPLNKIRKQSKLWNTRVLKSFPDWPSLAPQTVCRLYGLSRCW